MNNDIKKIDKDANDEILFELTDNKGKDDEEED